MKFFWKKGLLAGVAVLVLAFVINWVVGLILPSVANEYQTAMFRPWSDTLMMLYYAYPFILGLVAAYLWDMVGKPKPLEFAKLYFIIATIPGMFITYSSFQISLTMVLLWAITGFVQIWLAAYVFTKVK